MSDREKVQIHLAEITNKETAIDFYARALGRRPPLQIVEGNNEVRDSAGQIIGIPFERWWEVEKIKILNLRGSSAGLWNRVCDAAGVQPDDAAAITSMNESNTLTRESNEISRDALKWSKLAIGASFVSVVVAILALLVSIVYR